MMAVNAEVAPPIGSTDWTIPQNWKGYTPEQHATWGRLFERQSRLLPGRVVTEFMDGLDVLPLSKSGIPDFDELSEALGRRTGWSVVAVPGLIPDEAFFDHLAHRRFPAGNFIRNMDQLDYLQEPDIFHDVFGHVPLIAHPVFADYMQAYGEGGVRAIEFGAVHMLARLYWHTVEFGLIRSEDGLRFYGAGTASSFGEAQYALDDPSPHRLKFDLSRVLRTAYRIDDYQRNYFVIDSFDELLDVTLNTDFQPLYAEAAQLPVIEVAQILPSDGVLWRGTQSRAQSQSNA